KPNGASLLLIEDKWNDFDAFKKEFSEVALGIKGSGWCYLSKNGSIKVIPNHKSTKGIALLLDMWEHAYILDYGSDKQKYINSFWKIIDWNKINERIIS